MSIGDTLAQARRQANLTVTQVSQRTCIRETIIRGIERGDYSFCGGDFYARGHIRSIARAVGLDPEPLIREYDQTLGTPQPITAADVFEPATPIKIRERRRPNWSMALIVALAAAAGLVAYHEVSSHSGSRDSPAASTTGTAHQRAARPTPTPTLPTPTPPASRPPSPAPTALPTAARTAAPTVAPSNRSTLSIGPGQATARLPGGRAKQAPPYRSLPMCLRTPGRRAQGRRAPGHPAPGRLPARSPRCHLAAATPGAPRGAR